MNNNNSTSRLILIVLGFCVVVSFSAAQIPAAYALRNEIDAFFKELRTSVQKDGSASEIWSKFMSKGFVANNQYSAFEEVLDSGWNVKTLSPVYREVYENVAIVVVDVEIGSEIGSAEGSFKTFFLSKSVDGWRLDNFPLPEGGFAFGALPRFVAKGIWNETNERMKVEQSGHAP